MSLEKEVFELIVRGNYVEAKALLEFNPQIDINALNHRGHSMLFEANFSLEDSPARLELVQYLLMRPDFKRIKEELFLSNESAPFSTTQSVDKREKDSMLGLQKFLVAIELDEGAELSLRAMQEEDDDLAEKTRDDLVRSPSSMPFTFEKAIWKQSVEQEQSEQDKVEVLTTRCATPTMPREELVSLGVFAKKLGFFARIKTALVNDKKAEESSSAFKY